MAILSVPPIIEYGVASYALPGEAQSGDRHLVLHRGAGVLIAAIDGLGHGYEAAFAAESAVSILENSEPEDSVISLVQHCHEGLRSTRGAAMSLASIDAKQGQMTWIAVGNVQGVMLRRQSTRASVPDELLLRAGVVGERLPPLQAAMLPISKGDTLVFVTDGIHSDFVLNLSPLEPPQKSANRILAEHRRGNDDALVLVTRYLENHQ
jgi:negative regulator of sigma-B (phosphoserine phosphatase)